MNIICIVVLNFQEMIKKKSIVGFKLPKTNHSCTQITHLKAAVIKNLLIFSKLLSVNVKLLTNLAIKVTVDRNYSFYC